MTQPPSSVWVCIETTQEVVALGLRTILETADGPFEITTTGPAGDEPDVVLYDVIHMRDGDDSGLDHWLTETASTVIAIDRTLRPELGARAKEKGVEWAIDLGITADELVAVIRDAIAGNLEDNPAAQEWDAGGYPGSEDGLSSAGVGRAGTGHRGAEQPRDRQHAVLEHQFRQDLHPQHLPQDGCRDPAPGRPVGHPARVPDARTTAALADRHRASQPVALAASSTRIDTFPAPRRAPLTPRSGGGR